MRFEAEREGLLQPKLGFGTSIPLLASDVIWEGMAKRAQALICSETRDGEVTALDRH